MARRKRSSRKMQLRQHVAHAPMLESLEPRVLLSGSPALNWFDVAGQDISNGGATYATSKIVGPSRDVWVESRWTNTGADNSGHGGITLSFPGYQYFSNLGISIPSDFYYSADGEGTNSTTYKQKGDSINTASGGATASHIMFEGDDTIWDGSDWLTSESHTIGVCIYTPSTSTAIKATVRTTMGDSNWGSIVRNPSSGSANGDQQGWPTYYYTIYIDADAPYAPSGVDITPDSTNDTGQSQTDNLTKNANPKFQWNAPADRGYNSAGTSGTKDYFWEITNSSGSVVKSGSTSATSVNPGTLSDGNYTFWVQAEDNVGNWGNWGSINFTVDTAAPTKPASLLPNGNTGSQRPTLSWGASNGTGSAIDYYHVSVWWDDWTQGWPELWNGNTTGTGITLGADLVWGRPYKWSVTAYDAAGNSISSDNASLVASDTTAPTGPTNLAFSPNTSGWTNDNTPTFTWTAATDSQSGLKGYRIWV
ncbi:MAG: Ig-like domain-containing protein, partial [Planctomycetota bacterium]|nr:Ig-like domain-containing protein [Planctomycetota bacterium]